MACAVVHAALSAIIIPTKKLHPVSSRISHDSLTRRAGPWRFSPSVMSTGSQQSGLGPRASHKQRRFSCLASSGLVARDEASEEGRGEGELCPSFSPTVSEFAPTASKGWAAVPVVRASRSSRVSWSKRAAGSRQMEVILDDSDSDYSPDIPEISDDGERAATVERKTKETDVKVTIDLDGTGICHSDTGIPFLDHMIDQLASHGLFDLNVQAEGDYYIDDHHTNEDVALALGSALAKALGDRKGIHRFGDFSAPLDEALVHVVLDLSGRPHLSFDLNIPSQRVGTFDTQLVEHFFQSLVNTSGMTLHIRQLAGKNSHHIIEATFKAFARALRRATESDERRQGSIPSSKGVLSRS